MDVCFAAGGLDPVWVAIGALILSVVGMAASVGYKLGRIAQKQQDSDERRREDLEAMGKCQSQRSNVEHDLFARLGGIEKTQSSLATVVARMDGKLATLCGQQEPAPSAGD